MKIVVLTGAGISAESGIKTFRDSNGLWENHSVEDVATPEGFKRDPKLVQRFYNLRRAQLKEVESNPAHQALADLEKRVGSENFVLITQNVDDLHERAGSVNVLHMHGELKKVRCEKTGKVESFTEDITDETECSCCGEANRLRPHIVWFGEMPFFMHEINNHLNRADLFISIGTSNQVYPAAQFVAIAKEQGAKCVELNLERTQSSHIFDDGVYGKASEVVPEYLGAL